MDAEEEHMHPAVPPPPPKSTSASFRSPRRSRKHKLSSPKEAQPKRSARAGQSTILASTPARRQRTASSAQTAPSPKPAYQPAPSPSSRLASHLKPPSFAIHDLSIATDHRLSTRPSAPTPHPKPAIRNCSRMRRG